MNMSKKKSMFLTIAAVLSCIVVVVCVVTCSHVTDATLCEKVDIVIEDYETRKYVDVKELENYLKSVSYYSLGQPVGQIDCYSIEQALLGHSMIRTAHCHKTAMGVVSISVSQRVPVFSVNTSDTIYWVDSDRRVMPCCEGVEPNILPIFGSLTVESATEDIFDFVMWLDKNEYWKEKISSVQIDDSNSVILNQVNYDAKILLGTLSGYEDKLARLQKLYIQGFDVLGYPECQELDLRFNGQVVRR